jgi:hypothetical protein
MPAQLRTTRQRVRALTSRLNNMLKGYPGEPSEKGGRLCIAAPAGSTQGGKRQGRYPTLQAAQWLASLAVHSVKSDVMQILSD